MRQHCSPDRISCEGIRFGIVEALGASRPRRLPRLGVRAAAGDHARTMAARSQQRLSADARLHAAAAGRLSCARPRDRRAEFFRHRAGSRLVRDAWLSCEGRVDDRTPAPPPHARQFRLRPRPHPAHASRIRRAVLPATRSPRWHIAACTRLADDGRGHVALAKLRLDGRRSEAQLLHPPVWRSATERSRL